MSFKILYRLLITIICVFILVPAFFIPTFSSNLSSESNSPEKNNNREQNISYRFEINSKGFVWPTPRIY